MALFEDLEYKLKQEFPKFKVVEKENSQLMKFFNFFAKLWNPYFMRSYTTVLGYTVYMPASFINTVAGYDILRHEAVHMRQFKKWNILQTISYAILPIGPSFRAYWEYQGYVESMRVRHELGWGLSDTYIEDIVGQFTGPAYLFMWPFGGMLRKKFQAERSKILGQ